MAISCEIFQGSLVDCLKPLQGGTKDRLYLMEQDNISSYVYDGDNPSIINNIILKNNTLAYLFEGQRQSVTPSVVSRQGRYNLGYDHQISFLVFDRSQLTKDNIENMAKGNLVAIVANADNTFEIYGTYVGLEVSESGFELLNNDTSGAPVITLKTSDNTSAESKYPQTFFNTDLLTTQAEIDSLTLSPRIDSTSPLTGVIAGGETFTVKGVNFTGIFAAEFHLANSMTYTPAASFNVVSDIQINVVSPALAAGAYNIKLENSYGSAEGFEYISLS